MNVSQALLSSASRVFSQSKTHLGVPLFNGCDGDDWSTVCSKPIKTPRESRKREFLFSLQEDYAGLGGKETLLNMGADSSKQATTPIINANTQGAAEDDKEEEEEVQDFDSFKDDSTLTTRSSTGLGSGAGHWSSSLSSDRRFLSQSSSAGHGGSTNASSGPSRHDYSYFDESHSVLLQSYATNSMVSTKDRHRGLKRAGKTTTTAGAAASLSKAHPAASSSYRTSRHSTSTTLRHERYK